jgi:hypothetical protein
VSAFHSLAFPVPLPQIWHCSNAIYHLQCLYPEAEVNQGNFRNAPFPCQQWVQNTQRAPQNPPECQIFSKCQWYRCSIKYLAFRWGIGGFELGEELRETGRVGFSRGRPFIGEDEQCLDAARIQPKGPLCSFIGLAKTTGIHIYSIFYGISSTIRSYTAYIYGRGQPYSLPCPSKQYLCLPGNLYNN